MKTQEKEYFEAKWLVNWMGQQIPCCLKHSSDIRKLAQFMGFIATISKNENEKFECNNCKHEKNY